MAGEAARHRVVIGVLPLSDTGRGWPASLAVRDLRGVLVGRRPAPLQGAQTVETPVQTPLGDVAGPELFGPPSERRDALAERGRGTTPGARTLVALADRQRLAARTARSSWPSTHEDRTSGALSSAQTTLPLRRSSQPQRKLRASTMRSPRPYSEQASGHRVAGARRDLSPTSMRTTPGSPRRTSSRKVEQLVWVTTFVTSSLTICCASSLSSLMPQLSTAAETSRRAWPTAGGSHSMVSPWLKSPMAERGIDVLLPGVLPGGGVPRELLISPGAVRIWMGAVLVSATRLSVSFAITRLSSLSVTSQLRLAKIG
ncbi:hypothetical protein YW7DRAFT_02348 [Streptomyces sp. AmelKG-E11A]|nr:hypothetical protein YW7DRAFT_02348 [Streptomyces sp. AmelKG-E11A]